MPPDVETLAQIAGFNARGLTPDAFDGQKLAPRHRITSSDQCGADLRGNPDVYPVTLEQ